MESDVAEHLDADAMLDGIDNALVRLVGYDQVELIDGDLFTLANAIQAGHHTADRFGEDFSTFHLDEATVAEGNRQTAAIFALGGQFRRSRRAVRPSKWLSP